MRPSGRVIMREGDKALAWAACAGATAACGPMQWADLVPAPDTLPALGSSDVTMLVREYNGREALLDMVNGGVV